MKRVYKKILSACVIASLCVGSLVNVNVHDYSSVEALSGGYNSHCDAENYAKKYYKNGNTSYKDLSNKGGDCTNFVSQCLDAGHLAHKTSEKTLYFFTSKSSYKNWFHSSKSDYSDSWVHASLLREHLETRCSMSCKGFNNSNRCYDAFNSCSAGDVLFMGGSSNSTDVGHVIYIGNTYTYRDGSKKVVAYGHTANSKYEVTLYNNKISSVYVDNATTSGKVSNPFSSYGSFRLEKTSSTSYK